MVASNLHSSVWHIKNKREKSWEKTDFIGVWLEWKGRWKIGRTYLFSPIAYQNFISLIWGKNKKEKNNCIQWLSTLLSKKKIIIIKRLIYPFLFWHRFACCFFTSFFFFSFFAFLGVDLLVASLAFFSPFYEAYKFRSYYFIFHFF